MSTRAPRWTARAVGPAAPARTIGAQVRRRLVSVVPFALALTLAACADPAAEAPTPPAPPASPSDADEPVATAAPSATPSSDPVGDWQVVETADGLFRWRIPGDWSVVDESFEAEDDLGWVNQLTVVSDREQELAFFGSAHYGDRGGTCGDGTIDHYLDEHGYVPAVIHAVETIDLGEGLVGYDGEPVDEAQIAAYTYSTAPDAARFFAGFTDDELQEDRVPCMLYSDVPVPEGYPFTSFGTTFDDALWRLDSAAQGEYAETEEYRELLDMFRSLELTGAER